MLSRSPGVHSAGCWLSLLHLISIFSGPQFNQGSRGPLRSGLAFPTASRLSPSPTLLQLPGSSNSTELYNRSTPTRSSSSGNNCHTVHQSMSVPWEFFSSSHFISQFPPTRFPLITAIRMCHLLPVHHLGMAFFGRVKRSKYNSC